MKEQSMLSHSVYFTLKNSSDAACDAMIADCQKYLKDHKGVVFFGVGRLASEYNRPVNVRDYDIALNIVFDGRESHDTYQVHEQHLEFIAKNKEGWEQVRVFDADVA